MLYISVYIYIYIYIYFFSVSEILLNDKNKEQHKPKANRKKEIIKGRLNEVENREAIGKNQ